MTTNRSLMALAAVCLLSVDAAFHDQFRLAQAQGPSRPPAKIAAEPAIPGLPPLPPGVELPADVNEQLKKALQNVKVPQPTPPAKPGPVTPKTAAPKTAVPSAAAATTFKRVAVETKLGPVGDLSLSRHDKAKPKFWVSPDGRRIAYLFDKGIAVDGKAYQYKNSIRQNDQYVMHFRFSPDSKHTSWVVQQGGEQGTGKGETLVLDGVPEAVGWNFIANHDGGVFSPDSQHVAYTARRYVKSDVEYVLMVDGKEREVFTKSPAWRLSFTPDSRRVVWAESVEDRYQMRETSVDGKEPRIEHKFGPAQLTMNYFYGSGGQLGYIASDPGGQKFVMYDGQEYGPRFKTLTNLLVSRDGKHLGFVGEPESFRRVVVVDRKASKTYGGLDDDLVKDSLVLSPTGGRSAYATKRRDGQRAVIDHKEGKAYSGVAEITFSPDGKRVAYWAARGGKLYVVADGQEGAAYDELGLPVFSPDGKTLAHGAGIGPRMFVVTNGQPQKSYAQVGEPEFSPDGKRLVYLAYLSADGPTLLVDSGKEGKQYEGIKEDLYFNRDGQRLAMVAFAGDEQLVVVDGVEGNRYDVVVTLGGGKVHFDTEDQFHYLAVKDGELFLVEETIER